MTFIGQMERVIPRVSPLRLREHMPRPLAPQNAPIRMSRFRPDDGGHCRNRHVGRELSSLEVLSGGGGGALGDGQAAKVCRPQHSEGPQNLTGDIQGTPGGTGGGDRVGWAWRGLG